MDEQVRHLRLIRGFKKEPDRFDSPHIVQLRRNLLNEDRPVEKKPAPVVPIRNLRLVKSDTSVRTFVPVAAPAPAQGSVTFADFSENDADASFPLLLRTIELEIEVSQNEKLNSRKVSLIRGYFSFFGIEYLIELLKRKSKLEDSWIESPNFFLALVQEIKSRNIPPLTIE